MLVSGILIDLDRIVGIAYQLDDSNRVDDGSSMMLVEIIPQGPVRKFQETALAASGWERPQRRRRMANWWRLLANDEDAVTIGRQLPALLTEAWGVSAAQIAEALSTGSLEKAPGFWDATGSEVRWVEFDEEAELGTRSPESVAFEGSDADEVELDVLGIAQLLRQSFGTGGSEIVDVVGGHVQWIDQPGVCMHFEASDGGPGSVPMRRSLVSRLAKAGWGRPGGEVRNSWFQITEESDIPAAAALVFEALTILDGE